MNTLDKIQSEYRSNLANDQSVWLKIRLTAGMEMLAQELSTGRRIFEQDVVDPVGSPTVYPQVQPIEGSPVLSPASPASPSPAPSHAITRRRSQHWMLDASGSFPVLFVEENLVSFYATMPELKQALSDRGPDGREKLILNTAHVISIEKVIVRRSFGQSLIYPDVAAGVDFQEPPVQLKPLEVLSPSEIPVIGKPTDEMMFQIKVAGGQAPYRFSMINAPKDLWVSTDGWVRGFIEEDQWPTTGFREFLLLILVEDCSIPVQTAALEFRYRLFPLP